VGRIPLVLGVLLSLTAQSSATQDKLPQQPTFKTGVDLVTIDATVVDKGGQPVTGLTSDDFIVTLEGHVRPVRLLDYREYGHITPSNVPAGGDLMTKPPPVRQTRGGRIVVLVFDDLSFKPGPGKTLLTAAERTLSSFDADDLVGLTTTSGLGPVINPTRDRAAIIVALHDKRLIGRSDDSSAPFEITEEEALDIRRDFPQTTLLRVIARECVNPSSGLPTFVPKTATPTRSQMESNCASAVRNAAIMLGDMTLRRMKQQLAAYHDIIGTLSHAPDMPRVIIALTRGIALGLDTSQYADSLEELTRTAADSNVEFYALSELPDAVDFSSHLEAPDLLAAGKFMNSGAQVVANAAGGEAFLIAGTADRFFKRIESETSGIYRLGVEVPTGSDTAHYLKTSVRVRTPGVSVRANRMSVVPSLPAVSVDPDNALRARLAEGGTSFGVPLTAGAEMRRDPTDATQIEIDVSAEVPASVTGPVTLMYGLMDDKGRVGEVGHQRLLQTDQRDYQVAFPIRVKTGQYRLRVVASDANGHIGSVDKPLSAALARAGTYGSSDLLTAWTDAQGISTLVTLDTLPHDVHTLIVRLELYRDAPGKARVLQVRFQLLQAGLNSPIATDEITPSVSGTTRVAVASLSIQDLAPGEYTIRATVLEDGAEVGTQSATFKTGSLRRPPHRPGRL
jgi:VWFA-related protein